MAFDVNFCVSFFCVLCVQLLYLLLFFYFYFHSGIDFILNHIRKKISNTHSMISKYQNDKHQGNEIVWESLPPANSELNLQIFLR